MKRKFGASIQNRTYSKRFEILVSRNESGMQTKGFKKKMIGPIEKKAFEESKAQKEEAPP